MEYALKVENLTKKYDDFLLDNVSFELPKGCIMGFIGQNGAGKSTTIKAILDIVKRDGGEVFFFNKSINSSLKSIKEDVGVVQDQTCIPVNLNADEVGKIMSRIYSGWNWRDYENKLGQFSLDKGKKIKDYSRGMGMKLQIAIALSHNPRLLILDEGTSGLDPVVREEILDIFLDFIQDDNHSVLMSSHILSDLEKISDYITYIHKGKILFSEQKDILLEQYGVLKCSKEEFSKIDKSLIKGVRENSFGVEALISKKRIIGKNVIDKASIEDIMVFMAKGGM